MREQLTGLKAAYVLGRFRERDPVSGQPILDAVLIQPRTPRVTTEIGH